ncbi:MAG: ABC transporter permease [Devosiaceae bacterium]|nr:ABC transporter permease [Devosiaceae bacterium MH13]
MSQAAADTQTKKQILNWINKNGILLALILLFVALSVLNQYFLTATNLTNVARQVSINGILAVGMTFVILTAGIDLSIGSIAAICGAVAASLVVGDTAMSPMVAILAGVGVGATLGLINGGLVGYAFLPPFVVTLGMLSVARGTTLIFTDGMPISRLSDEFKFLGQGDVYGLPIPTLIFMAVVIVSWFALKHTVYGRWVYAVGGNPRSARTSGVPVRGVITSVYVIMGALCGLAGLILTARTTAALPQAGVAYELDAIAAVVIGGTSLAGGVGGIGATVIGVLIIGLINNGLDLMGVSSYYQQIIKGSIIVLAVLLDRSRRSHH